jgi:hypothetical protein
MKTTYQTSIGTVRAGVTAKKNALQPEISPYPAPASGCDTQSNHLLADRQKFLEALRTPDRTVFVPAPRTATEAAGLESR